MKRQLKGNLEAERHARDSLVLSLLGAVCIALLLVWKLAPEQTPKATTQPTPANRPDLKAVTPLVRPNDRIWRLKEDHFKELEAMPSHIFGEIRRRLRFSAQTRRMKC
jgi:hypothetical protein